MAELERFDSIYQRASDRKGGVDVLESMLGCPRAPAQLARIGDDRFLAEFTKKVFQSGFVWRVVEQKWRDFERVFFAFDIDKVLLMPDEMLEKKATDPSIIRNYNKVKTVRENALMIDQVRRQHGSFARFVADWPADNIIGLWDYLKVNGARLGGNTGAYALRTLGKDTFLLSNDAVSYFSGHEIITGSARSKRSLAAIQQSFLTWQQQSGRSLHELSQILAFSVGDNYLPA